MYIDSRHQMTRGINVTILRRFEGGRGEGDEGDKYKNRYKWS